MAAKDDKKSQVMTFRLNEVRERVINELMQKYSLKDKVSAIDYAFLLIEEAENIHEVNLSFKDKIEQLAQSLGEKEADYWKVNEIYLLLSKQHELLLSMEEENSLLKKELSLVHNKLDFLINKIK